jgi:uncharacterized SAM-binding protein YcdF (DUF218 family)
VASDTRAPEAIIVIFGAAVRPDGSPSTTLRRRVEAAAAFGARHAAPLFIPTGGVGRYGASEASVMADLLRTFALPNATIVLEETGTDTLSSVRAVKRIIRTHGLSAPVYAATSRYHLLRCVLLLRMAGIRARACPPPAFPAAERLSCRWYWRLREVPALPFDLLLMTAIRLRGRA